MQIADYIAHVTGKTLAELFAGPAPLVRLEQEIDGDITIAYWDESLPEQPSAEKLAQATALTLGDVQSQRIAELTNACAVAIVSGYTSSALGADHHYPSQLTDQLNMMGSVTDSLLPGLPANWSTPFWCADAAGEWAYRSHTAEQIQMVGAAGKAHVIFCQTMLAGLTAEVEAVQTAEAVAAIVWPNT